MNGIDAVKKILDSATAVAIGVAELRNRGYGTGRRGLHLPPGGAAPGLAVS